MRSLSDSGNMERPAARSSAEAPKPCNRITPPMAFSLAGFLMPCQFCLGFAKLRCLCHICVLYALVYRCGSPKPPPPGVAMIRVSPACIATVVFASSSSMLPSLRCTLFCPHSPGLPPFNPKGAIVR